MNGDLINQKIERGYALAAAKVGATHSVYRAPSAISPLLSTPVVTTPIGFNIAGQYKDQVQGDQLLWEVIVDPTLVQVGDYLVGPHTWMVVGMEPLMPMVALRCTDKITASRGTESFSQTEGLHSSVQAYAVDVPCYIQLKRDKGFGAPAGYPAATNASAPTPEWIIYTGISGVTPAKFFKEGDMITLTTGQLLRIDAASSSTLTWQLVCTPYYPNA